MIYYQCERIATILIFLQACLLDGLTCHVITLPLLQAFVQRGASFNFLQYFIILMFLWLVRFIRHLCVVRHLGP
jgi:hypothetical protein